MKNSIGILLDLLKHVQSEFFNDAKAIDIHSWSHSDETYVAFKLRNEDTVKICVEYMPHVEDQDDGEQ